MPLLVDSHCHLDFPQFAGQLDEILARAKASDVGIVQTIGTKISKFPGVLAVAEQYPSVYASVGVHPHDAEKEKTTVEELAKFGSHPKVIGIGETGLDYYYEHSPRSLQQDSFRVHIEAARQTGCTVIVHSRNADKDTVDMLSDEMKKAPFRFLIHCFSSTAHLAERSIELGGYISLSGILTFRKSYELQEIAKNLPLNRLLVETDAPYLAPEPHRGKTNEPAFTRHTAEFLAQLKGLSYEEVARVTTDNFLTLFTKAKRPDA